VGIGRTGPVGVNHSHGDPTGLAQCVLASPVPDSTIELEGRHLGRSLLVRLTLAHWLATYVSGRTSAPTQS